MCATQSKSDLPQYFYIPPNATTRNYYICLTPPKALHHVVGKDKYRKSTGTADLRKAKPIGARLIAEKLAEWELAASKAAPPPKAAGILTSELIENICARRLYQWLHIDDLGRYEGRGYDDSNIKGLERIWVVTDQAMRSVLARGKLSPEWEDVLESVDDWCRFIETPVDRTDPLYPKLVRSFADVDLQGISMLRARNRGEVVSTPPVPTANATANLLSSMTDVYLEHLKTSRKGKSVTTSVGLWQKFVGYVGDIPIDDVLPKDIFNFLKHGLNDPNTLWSMQYAHGVVLRTLRSVFSLAISTDRRNGSNPVDSVVELPKIPEKDEQERLNPRRPYSDAEISKVFASEWYRLRSTRWRGKMASDLGARYWSPLICLFHGNRIREVLQLVASDFTVENDVQCITIQAEIKGGQPELLALGITRTLKNASTKRTVPLHPQLISLGFLDFLQERRDAQGDNALLFPSCLPERGGKSPILGRAYEQAYLRFVKDDIGDGLGNHGYRHQLEDRIRNAQTPGNQWPAGLGQQFMGRKSTRAADLNHVAKVGSEGDYGDGYTPELMLMYLKTLDFSAIKLPVSYAKWMELRAS